MRVVVVTTSYPSARAPYNGVFVREHCLALQERGHEVHVLVPRIFREDPLEVTDAGLTVHRFRFWSDQKLLSEYPSVPVLRMSTFMVSGLYSCVRLISRGGFDIVHGHWAIPTGLLATLAGKIKKRPSVITVHYRDIELATSGSRVMKHLTRIALRSCDHVIVVSRELEATLVTEFDVDPARVDVVPMGVDTRVFAPGAKAEARRILDVEQDMRLILFVGGLTEVKGVRNLVRALPAIMPGDDRVRLFLAGHGPLRDEIEQTAGTLGQSARLRFLGHVAHESIPTWMRAADVLVLPSRREGLPVCLMEAAAVGLPMVATDVGGSADVLKLDGRNVLVAFGDIKGLATAITGVLETADAGRTSMLEHSTLFTLDGSVGHLEALFARLTDT